jgi:lipopolysaccharide/colanic/teichoic acid biosynthesis glycosyltransferase
MTKEVQRYSIFLLSKDASLIKHLEQLFSAQYHLLYTDHSAQLIQMLQEEEASKSIVLLHAEVLSSNGINLAAQIRRQTEEQIPICLIASNRSSNLLSIAQNAGIAEVFSSPLDEEALLLRTNFLVKHWPDLSGKMQQAVRFEYKTPLIKRLFDILVAGTALLLLSPIILLVVLLIKLESNGPVIYYSLRVGTGYRIFRFYKFRSMYTNADRKLKELKHLNQYGSATAQETVAAADYLCEDCRSRGIACQRPIYTDKETFCEKAYEQKQKAEAGAAFLKIQNDPRITRVGRIIRNTSFDELPQLWNVIIGDMSIVGNRPLPLYEAEKLTTDKYMMRFMAPAGITGLWQVEKRGKGGDMSEEERIMLDNAYARDNSFIKDIRLILRTIPALFQKENV